MSLVYIEKLPASLRTQFESKVKSVSEYLGIDPNWLMQLMKAESGLNPQARNIQQGRTIAVGLIQFINDTALGLGTTMDALYGMNAINQLDYVRKYFTPYRNKMKSYSDVYFVTFFPAAIGKPNNWVFQTSKLSASKIAAQNPAVNINKDNQITVGEFRQYLQNTVPFSLHSLIFGGGNLLVILLAVSMILILLTFKN